MVSLGPRRHAAPGGRSASVCVVAARGGGDGVVAPFFQRQSARGILHPALKTVLCPDISFFLFPKRPKMVRYILLVDYQKKKKITLKEIENFKRIERKY